MNGASPDLSSEKREIAENNKKIANGVKAVMSGMDIPELREEIDKLRTRNSELEEVIKIATSSKYATVDEAALVEMFRNAADTIDEEPDRAIRNHITKIYAAVDGSYTVNVGVHTVGSPGAAYIVCATFIYNAA